MRGSVGCCYGIPTRDLPGCKGEVLYYRGSELGPILEQNHSFLACLAFVGARIEQWMIGTRRDEAGFDLRAAKLAAKVSEKETRSGFTPAIGRVSEKLHELSDSFQTRHSSTIQRQG